MRRRVLVVAGASAAVALAVAGGVAYSRPDAPSAAPGTAPAPSAAVESACGLSGTPGDGTQGAAAATWAEVSGWPLPTSTTDGPGTRTPTGPWSCFTHTPSGAVLAGYVIAMRSTGLADDWRAVVREQTIPGPGQAVLLGSVPNTPDVVTPRGYDLAAYDESRATIRYRLSTATGEFSCTTDVRWSDNDWRLVLGDDGSTSSGCARGVPEAFTPWGPT